MNHLHIHREICSFCLKGWVHLLFVWFGLVTLFYVFIFVCLFIFVPNQPILRLLLALSLEVTPGIKPYKVQGIKPKLVAWKASLQPTLLSMQPIILYFNSTMVCNYEYVYAYRHNFSFYPVNCQWELYCIYFDYSVECCYDFRCKYDVKWMFWFVKIDA